MEPGAWVVWPDSARWDPFPTPGRRRLADRGCRSNGCALPSLPSVVERSSSAFLPEDAPTLNTLHRMDESFGSGRTESFVYVVFRNQRGSARSG